MEFTNKTPSTDGFYWAINKRRAKGGKKTSPFMCEVVIFTNNVQVFSAHYGSNPDIYLFGDKIDYPSVEIKLD